jgi:hypothetical protein
VLSAFAGSVGPALLNRLWDSLPDSDSLHFGAFNGPRKFGKRAARLIATAPVEAQANFEAACERIWNMADEAGFDCILRNVGPDKPLAEVIRRAANFREGATACWIDDFPAFAISEHECFAGNYRLGKFWKQFQLPDGPLPKPDLSDNKKNALATEIARLGDPKHPPVVEVHQTGIQASEVLGTVYAARGKRLLTSLRNGGVTWVPFPNVVEFAVGYSPASRCVETVGRGFPAATHPDVARAFARHILGVAGESLTPLPALRYNLSALRSDNTLKTDAEDGIEFCHAVQLTCRASPWGNLMTLHHAQGRLWARARKDLGSEAVRALRRRPPLSARIRAEWQPSAKYPHGKVITFDIAAGSETRGGNCTLRERSRAERLLLQKYMRKWEFLTR